MEKRCRSRVDFFAELLPLLRNDLEVPVFTLEKEVLLIKEQLLQKGLAALVSGSGPTVFALSVDEDRLQRVGEELAQQGFRVIFTETVQQKKYIIENN